MEASEIIEKSRIREWMKGAKGKCAGKGIYYIVQRAPGDGKIFVDSEDYLKFLSLINDTEKKFQIGLINFCLVSNYLQLLIKIKGKNISLSMKNLFERYADYFNNKHQRKGHVFCGRYKSVFCDNQRYLLALFMYIDLTSCREKLATWPEKYKWGSARICGKTGRKYFSNVKGIRELKDKESYLTCQRYRKLLKEFKGKVFTGELRNLRGPENFILYFNKYLFQNQTLGNISEGEIVKYSSRKRVISSKGRRERGFFLQKLKNSGLKNKEISRIVNISRWTIYRDLAQSKGIKCLHSGKTHKNKGNEKKE